MTGENVASLVPDWPEIAPPPRLGLGSRFHCLQKETRAPIRAIQVLRRHPRGHNFSAASLRLALTKLLNMYETVREVDYLAMVDV